MGTIRRGRSKSFRHAAILLISLLFLSCEEVIDIDLDEVHDQIVIEGVLSDNHTLNKIKISMTESIFQKSQPKDIRGAQVTISDDAGNSETLAETQPGLYLPAKTYPIAPRIYTLRVEVNGMQYTAVSNMPSPMTMDSIKHTDVNTFWGFFSETKLQYYLTNKPGVEEYCLIKAYNQNSTSFYWTLYSDKYSDGQQVIVNSPSFSPTGNVIRIELISIDKATYEYFHSLREIIGEGDIEVSDFFKIKDFNPKSNLSNNALGYFSAQAQRNYQVYLQ
ncbi:MAG: DUF4249 family protein [bacterium]